MKYFTRKEIMHKIMDNLLHYDDHNNVSDLFDDLFNGNCYITGNYTAAKVLDSNWQDDWKDLLKNYDVTLPGVFGSLQLVRHYDEATVGFEDISIDEFLKPEMIATKVEYILAAYEMDQILINNGLDYESRLTSGVKELFRQYK